MRGVARSRPRTTRSGVPTQIRPAPSIDFTGSVDPVECAGSAGSAGDVGPVRPDRSQVPYRAVRSASRCALSAVTALLVVRAPLIVSVLLVASGLLVVSGPLVVALLLASEGSPMAAVSPAKTAWLIRPRTARACRAGSRSAWSASSQPSRADPRSAKSAVIAPNGTWTTGTRRKSVCQAAAMAGISGSVGVRAVPVSGSTWSVLSRSMSAPRLAAKTSA